MNIDNFYMQRCLELAKNGIGNTYPNPLVGSVIVYNNEIIGEGYHTKSGEPHAEINAINSVKNKKLLKKSTLYVNLEPCSHWGKTPPCSIKIAELGIPKVVIGTLDTTDKVSGKGVKILLEAGIDVKIGILEKEARELNKRFFTFHEKKRPYVILKWAQSADGFIDKIRNIDTPIGPNWITGKIERTLVHKWRAEEQSILVGTNTVEKDNPSLTTRNWFGNNPIRLFIDKNLRTNPNSSISDKTTKTICFNTIKENFVDKNLQFVKISTTKSSLEQILNYLYELNIQSVIVEGGQKLLNSFIEEELWDECRVFIGENIFLEGIKAPEIEVLKHKTIKFSNSTLISFKSSKA
ncbi:MAG: bifunctional diaminohydroxyphosphoribosylaminopyrimidine deaminase/5-amino-6-(5-phosphoribosylamino)uracil reductase RibD [Bacteroidales bacterium]|nr:bifunctional diaminohydroxyphosphoribosylaminopyrimidine deaminase/5-amino-6-(5-phosphoribosylamino)uracil reductase RibD [Bacteroidales bacterium]